MTPAQRLIQRMRELPGEPYLKGLPIAWWPQYFYHHSDVRNAAEILKDARLTCRAELDRTSGIRVDSASQTVIRGTDASIKEFVRLYFRPQTPTHFNIEGIRPQDQLGFDRAHCPVPIFFLFPVETVLSRGDCCFSKGSLGVREPELWLAHANWQRFQSLPFDEIFHYGPFGRERRGSIVFHRQAEIVVPGTLPLSNSTLLKARSPAEKETLLSLLPSRLRDKWERRIFIDSKNYLFLKRWSFVERVDMGLERIVFKFSPDTSTPGPFNLRFDMRSLDDGSTYFIEKEHNGRKELRVLVPQEVNEYEVTLQLDGHLAYQGRFELEAVPF